MLTEKMKLVEKLRQESAEKWATRVLTPENRIKMREERKEIEKLANEATGEWLEELKKAGKLK